MPNTGTESAKRTCAASIRCSHALPGKRADGKTGIQDEVSGRRINTITALDGGAT